MALTRLVEWPPDCRLADFFFVSTSGALVAGSNGSVQSRLGAPGPENTSSPQQPIPGLVVSVLDAGALATAPPNRVRFAMGTPEGSGGSNGTILLRRRLTNTSRRSITKLRFRAVRLTSLNSPGYSAGGTQADLRLLSSTNESSVATSTGTVAVVGTTLETTPAQSLGGGTNSSVIEGTITLAQPLPSDPGTSGTDNTRNFAFLFGVEKTGSFAITLSLEASAP